MPAPPKDINKHKTKTIKEKSKGDAVTCLQNALNSNGEKLAVDGQFGGGTKKAVVRYQKKNKLDADGIVGPKTWATLAGKAPPKEKPEPKEAEEKQKQDSQPSANQCIVKVRVLCPGSNRSMQPVQGAEIRIGRVKKKTATRGDAALTVRPGKYEVEVSKRGYVPMLDRKIEVRAEAGKTMEIRIDMKAG